MLNDPKTILNLIAGTFLLMGCILGIISFFIIRRVITRQKDCTQPAPGTVIRTICKSERIGRGDTETLIYYPVYRYCVKDYMGKAEIIKQSTIGQTRQHFADGEKVKIWYDPADPEKHYVQEIEPHPLIIVFCIVSMTSVLIGAILINIRCLL